MLILKLRIKEHQTSGCVHLPRMKRKMQTDLLKRILKIEEKKTQPIL